MGGPASKGVGVDGGPSTTVVTEVVDLCRVRSS